MNSFLYYYLFCLNKIVLGMIIASINSIQDKFEKQNDCAKFILIINVSNESDVQGWKQQEWRHKSGKLFIKAFTRPISIEEDSQIFRGCVMEFPNHNESFGLPKSVAIKEVFFRENEFYKSKAMMKHEVDILKMATRIGAKYVVKLIDFLYLPNSLVMVLELGSESLNMYIKRLKTEWRQRHDEHDLAITINANIKSILIQMVIALKDLHRFAVHLALKSENWLYINRNGENVLALIDFQTSAPIQQNGSVDMSSRKKRKELRSFICKTVVGRTNLPRTRRFASPEHAKFCGDHRGKNEVTVQTDIWSLGILLLDILAHTPQIDAICGGSTYKMSRQLIDDQRANLKILRNAFVQNYEFTDSAKNDADNDDKERLNGQVKSAVQIYFPNYYVLIEKMLSFNPNDRPTIEELLNELIA